MSERLKDILSNLSPEIDQETLLLYLQNKLPADKKHEVEKKLLESQFAEDAEEGLRQLADKETLPEVIDQLNRGLRNKLLRKRRRIERIHIKQYPWVYLAVIIIILLIIISYFVIQALQKR